MTNRIVLAVADGLKVSKPGTNVLTAGVKDLWFSSGSQSFPLVEKISFHMTGAWGNEQTAYFSRTYPARPTVSVFYAGATDPAGQALADRRFLGMSVFQSNGFTRFVASSAPTGSENKTFVWIKLYNNRIVFQNMKSNQSGSDMIPFSGYIYIIVYGFYND